MNLIQIDIIRAQIMQAGFNILRHRFLCAGHGLGRQHKFFAQAAFQRFAQKRLADRVAARGIDIIHAALRKPLHQFPRDGRVHLLNRNAAEAHARHAQAGFAQSRIFHCDLSLFFCLTLVKGIES